MRRREFITLLGGAAAWPLAARAQQPAMPIIGWLGSETREAEDFRVVPFREGLKKAGFLEGQNLAIEYRIAEGQYDRLPGMAADLVHRQVSVIALTGLPAALAAKGATATIPIVFQIADDPIQLGLVASLGRPGGNVTGVTSLNVEVAQKQVELLHELVPNTTAMALIVNPANAARAESITRETQDAAHKLGLELHVLHASVERELDAAFASAVRLRAGALVIGTDSFFFGFSRSGQLGALALRYAIPAISPYREFAAAGGLISYGTNNADQFRLVGVYTARVLKGEKPADLPVQQATTRELYINLKTAKALGITVPLPLSGRADEIFE
jgi:putative ABC transport system substrate-binding protein